MAERRFSLATLLRRKKKEGPETAPAGQPEDVQQSQPLQEDPGRHRTQEQDRASGRFRRAAQAFLKLLGIRPRKTRTTTPTDVLAQPDPTPSELQPEPDVGTPSTDGTANCGSAVTDEVTNSNTALPELTTEAEGATAEGIADTDSTPVQRLPDAPSVAVLEEGVVSAQVTTKPDTVMEQRPPSVPKLAWVEEEEQESPGPAPTHQPEEVEHSQPLQEDPGQHQTQEQDRASGRFLRAAQAILIAIQRRTAKVTPAEVLAQPDPTPSELQPEPDVGTALTDGTANCGSAVTDEVTNSNTALPELTTEAEGATAEGIADTDSTPVQRLPDAPSVAVLEEGVVSAQVPAFVRDVHQRLTANGNPEEKLLTELLRVTKAHPADVVVTLLCCAPSCDRAAASMWRAMASSERTQVKVLPQLLCVMEDWPWHSTSTSDGDNVAVFALAATRVIWEILQMFWLPESLMEYPPRLLVALLFQAFVSTEQMPEEVDTLWRGCQEQRDLPTKPNSFAVLTIKALLCHLECEDLVMSMERKRGWDTLLRADTHHYAVGLLAREMRRVSSPLCSQITLHLLELLSREKPCWDLPAVAFLVEVLDWLDMNEWGDSLLRVLSRHLRSECPERRRLALRGLQVLSRDPMMADGMQSLTQILLDVLWDPDGELVGMALSVFIREVQDRGTPISTPTALQLAEALQTLFCYDNIRVQLLSIKLFRKVLKLVVEEGKKALETHVIQSLPTLFFLSHDENEDLEDTSWEALIRAFRFLRRKDLKNLLEADELGWFFDCLVESEKKRVVEFMCQALPFLESPQETQQELAVWFIGIAGKYLRKGQEEDELITEVILDTLQGMTADSPAISKRVAKTTEILKDFQKSKLNTEIEMDTEI